MGFLKMATLRDEIYIDTPCSGELADAGAEILKSYASIPKAEYDQARKQAGKKKPGYNADNSYSFVGFFGAELERCKAVLPENVTRDQLPKAFRFPSCSNATLISPSFVSRLEIKIVALDNGQLKFETTFGFKSWHSKTVHDAIGLQDLSFGYAGNVSVKGVVKDFLTFALSGSNYTFQNLTSICVTLDFCTDANMNANLSSVMEVVNQTIQANQNKCFACPDVSVFVVKGGSPELVLSTMLREWSEAARNAYSTMEKMSVHYRRLSNGYLADGVLYNTCSDMRTFATVEGKCIEDVYVAIGKALENALAKAQMEEQGGASNILFGEEEESEPEQTDADTTDEFEGDFEGDFEGEESTGDDDVTVLARGATAHVMDLYHAVYSAGGYQGVVIVDDAHRVAALLRGYSADKRQTFKLVPKSFGFNREQEQNKDEALFNQFRAGAANTWLGLASTYGISAKGVSEDYPKTEDDLEWIVKVTNNNRPTVAWFPNLHLALMNGFYPWELKKQNCSRHSWSEMKPKLEAWFMAVFSAIGAEALAKKDVSGAVSDINAWRDTFERHFIVGRDTRSFRFSFYWKDGAVLDLPNLKNYFRSAGAALADEDSSEKLSETNEMLTCTASEKIKGLVAGSFMPDLMSYLGAPFMGYETFLGDMKMDPEKVVMGRTLKGVDVSMSLKGGMGTFPAVIRAGGRSGKGVLTQLLMINLLGCGYPFIYLDCKPEMGVTWYKFGERFNCKALAADAMSDNSIFVPEASRSKGFLNPCIGSVMDAHFGGVKNGLQYGKLATLIDALIAMRSSTASDLEAMFCENGQSGHWRTVFVIVDEVNMMLTQLKIGVPSLKVARSKFDTAYKSAKAAYKKDHKDAVDLPSNYELSVDPYGTYTVSEWESMFATGFDQKIKTCMRAIGVLAHKLLTQAPKYRISTIYIGQTGRLVQDTVKGAEELIPIVNQVSQANNMALIGREWSSMEVGAGPTQSLKKDRSAVLTDLTPGVFMFKKSKNSPKYETIKTGLLFGENDILTIGPEEAGDLTGMLMRNIRNSAGDEAAETFKKSKLLINAETKAALEKVGMDAEIGQPNPLVSFDGLMEYVARKSGKDITESVNWLYDELSKILRITGSGFTDVYDYLADYSAIYTFDDFNRWVTTREPLYTVEHNTDGGDSGFAQRVQFNKIAETQEHTKDKEVSYAMPEEPMPENPVRQQSQGVVLPPMPKLDRTAEVETGDADDKYTGVGNEYPVEDDLDVTALTANDAYADDSDAEQSEDYAGAQEEESTEMPGGISAADIADLVRAIAGDDDDDDDGDDEPVKAPQASVSQPVQAKPIQSESVKSEPVQSKPVQSEPMQSKPVQQKPVQQVIKPQAAPVKVRTTAAPPVASHQGAADRRTGSETVRENPDGTYTLAIPKGESKGYYTGVETVQTLNNVFTPSEAGKFSMFASGRMYMSLKCMERLVHMIEEKSGMTRAMIKNLTFADNCIFVRDACVVGGQPDSNELYDYVDIKYFLKAMRGLVQLRMDRDAYFNLIVRPGYKAQAVFQFSKTLNTFAFDKCSLLRDGRIVGEEPNSVKDSFIADFDGLVADNSIATSRSKMFSPRFNRRSERAEAMKHTSEYNERVLHLQKTKMKLYGKKAEEYMESGRHVAGLFARFRMWMIDRKVKKMEDAL